MGYQTGNQVSVIAKNLNFALSPRELTAIVGINGIGKSTLLRSLGNVQPKLSGDILIKTRALESMTDLELSKRISVVLTEPLASKNLSVNELISLGRQPYTNWIGRFNEEDQINIENAIDEVGLGMLREKKCFELSDGQLQKAMLARALAQNTPVLLLDEPTTHLDLYHKVQILKLLQKITEDKAKTVVFTTHEIELAIQLCDKILILGQDQHYFGAPSELIEAGHFNNLFPKEVISFDADSGSFKIQK